MVSVLVNRFVISRIYVLINSLVMYVGCVLVWCSVS